MDLRNPRIALCKTWIHTSRDNPWIHAYGRKLQIRGQSMDCAAQTTDCLVHSQVQSKVLKFSGVALPYDNNSNNIIIIIIKIPYHFRCE